MGPVISMSEQMRARPDHAVHELGWRLTGLEALAGQLGVDDLLLGLRYLRADYRASESLVGPGRAQCPLCRELSLDGVLPLTITGSGDVRCSHCCDAVKDRLLQAATAAVVDLFPGSQIERLPAGVGA